jgi:hypothetical protein
MMCRRRDFLAIGGFSEEYFYGLEDVDLCCRLRWRLGKAVLSLNSRSALHYKNSTRDRDAESRRPTEKLNRRVLQARCGYGIRREFVTRRLDDDGSFTGARFTVGIAVDADTALAAVETGGRAVGLGEALRRLGWDVRYLARNAWGSAADLDLYIAATPGPSVAGLSGAQPHLTTVRWIGEQEDAALADLGDWDLLLCPSEEVRERLPERDRARAEVVAPAEDLPGPPAGARAWTGQAAQLREAVRRRLAAPRIALKTAASDEALARALELALLRRGAPVRIDGEADWLGARAVGDDVAVVLPGAAAYAPALDQINIRLAAGREPASDRPFDAVERLSASGVRSRGAVRPQAADELAGRVLGLIDAAHRKRASGPDDRGPAETPQARLEREPAAVDA